MIEIPLETERLLIRPFEPERDAGPLRVLWGDDEAMQFIPGGARVTVDETRRQLASSPGRAPAGLGLWTIEERESGSLVGGVGLFPLN